MMKKFSLNKKYIFITIGFIIVSYIIYARVLLQRIPKDFTVDIHYLYLLFILFMSIFFNILLIIKVYMYIREYYLPILKEITNNKQEGIGYVIRSKALYIFIYIKNIIDTSLYELDYLIKDTIPFSGNIVEYMGRILIKLERYKGYPPVPPEKILVLRSIIMTLVPLIFVMEIILFKRLYDYYYVLVLLLIPLFLSYSIYSLKGWHKYQITGLDYCYTVELTDYIDQIVTPSIFAVFYCITPDYPVNFQLHYLPEFIERLQQANRPIEKDLTITNQFLILNCDILFYILFYERKISLYNKSIYPVINIALYAIGWTYLLIYLL